MKDAHASYIFQGELRQIQDPAAQAGVAHSLLRAGMGRSTPNSGWMENVHMKRIQTLAYFSGPRAVAAILRMLSSWDASWGDDAARAMNISRVARRLQAGVAGDLAPAVNLVRTLAALGHEDAASQLLGELLPRHARRFIAARLGLVADLLDVTRRLRPEALAQLVPAARTALDDAVRRTVVFDERQLWLEVGRCARLLRRVGVEPLQVGEPRIPPNLVHLPAVVWAATGLDLPDWGDQALARAAERRRHTRTAWSDPLDQVCLLVATAAGWDPNARADVRAWSIAAAPYWALRHFVEVQAGDALWESVLCEAEQALRERVTRGDGRPHWDASRLRLILDARAVTRAMVTPQAPDAPLAPAGESVD